MCEPRTVAYFVNWAIYGRKHFPKDLPVNNLTHILYAFANVQSEGKVILSDSWSDTEIHWEGDTWDDSTELFGCLKQLNILKSKNHHLNLLLSIGGWTYSENGKFASAVATDQQRTVFADSCVQLLKDHGFDGIDIDWEYPRDATEAANYVALLKVVREKLDAYSTSRPDRPHFELTVACPAGAEHFRKLDIAGMNKYLDFWNLMAYDYAGSWDGIAGHQANVYPSAHCPVATPFSTKAAVDHYHSHGVPMDKIVIGMPLYGRAFENTDGPGTAYSGTGQGSWEAGVYDYRALPLPGAQEQVDQKIVASYCYDPAKRIMVTYDNVEIARKKAEWIKHWGLGGGMWWESSADKTGDASLIKNVVDVFGGPGALHKKSNCLSYPDSKFPNMRNGSLTGVGPTPSQPAQPNQPAQPTQPGQPEQSHGHNGPMTVLNSLLCNCFCHKSCPQCPPSCQGQAPAMAQNNSGAAPQP